MQYQLLAADYDGTLANEGVVEPATVFAIERLVASGRKLVVVTGRRLGPLLATFPQITLAERIVAENGALLYTPATGATQALAPPPPAAFVDELRRRGVSPLAVGESIVATLEPQERIVAQVIGELGLALAIEMNKGSVMVLPEGISKASGLGAALAELAVAREDVVGVGDGENDLSLVQAAGFGVAVANAVPAVKRAARLVTRFPCGAGVAELVDALIATDLAPASRTIGV